MTYEQVATRLLASLTAMGEQHTNAVLLTLATTQTVRPYQHYPAESYSFGDAHWRTFYHCHQENSLDSREHGHFHFFTRAASAQDWAHVVAMGIDHSGLPLNLFTTNRWVTDGSWFDARCLDEQLRFLENGDETSLAVAWLRDMLLLFRETVADLLQQRDAELTRLCPLQPQQCYNDRSVYCLSQTNIDLRKQLYRTMQVQPVTTQQRNCCHHG